MGGVVMGGAAVHSPCLHPRVHCGVRFLTSGLGRALSFKNMILKERSSCRGSLEVEKGHFIVNLLIIILLPGADLI